MQNLQAKGPLLTLLVHGLNLRPSYIKKTSDDDDDDDNVRKLRAAAVLSASSRIKESSGYIIVWGSSPISSTAGLCYWARFLVVGNKSSGRACCLTYSSGGHRHCSRLSACESTIGTYLRAALLLSMVHVSCLPLRGVVSLFTGR